MERTTPKSSAIASLLPPTAAGGCLAGVWDPARHVVAPFLPPAEWPRWLAMDWGYRRPFSIGWYALRPADPHKIEGVDAHAEDHCRDELRHAVTARVTLSKQDLARRGRVARARCRPVLLYELRRR